MDKRRLHHLWTRIRWIKPWYFLALAALFGAVCVFALRANNQHMVTLREAVYAADRDNTGVQKPLKDLQAYVTSHMNTDLNAGKSPVYPPIQLKYTYERLVQAQKEQLAKANGELYSRAQAHCESQNPTDFSGRNRIPCIQEYVRANSAQPLPAIPDALYKFSFVTPRWSPDLAGWTMLAATISGLLFIVTFIARRVLRRSSR